MKKSNCKCVIVVGLITVAVSLVGSALVFNYKDASVKEAERIANDSMSNCKEVASYVGSNPSSAIVYRDPHDDKIRFCAVAKNPNISHSSYDDYFRFQVLPEDKDMKGLSNLVYVAVFAHDDYYKNEKRSDK